MGLGAVGVRTTFAADTMNLILGMKPFDVGRRSCMLLGVAARELKLKRLRG